MLKDLIKLRMIQGYQAIPDPLMARPPAPFRGLPINPAASMNKWNSLDTTSLCPTGALEFDDSHMLISMDLGKCIFCGNCSKASPDTENQGIQFTDNPAMSSNTRNGLILRTGSEWKPLVQMNSDLARIFSKSLKLRSVSAGGCNGCEMELGACSNVNFDMGRYGIDVLASPRHCDGLILTGPITVAMARALEATWRAIPEPRLLILAGACAISGGIFADSPQIHRRFLELWSVSLYVPGCPFHPLTMIQGIMKLLKPSS
ncbi:MAG: NADH:ubiquinone oxidoreductase [Candidatus Wallbacteria bacterium HGW-Wallbacteria-1]|jgi:Ni,Fe-hydrogenase III small subunit|uniref:NADH:ubiquinone oxidoreductase n=1 Tax=Candidatus Wallbacteria bacterium HGW-Wallbacteria-1 TaxID=2013854 RepID=A0A2N1PPN3_9BACT|nr:MAG: NADH:ubiquinone oxidoreductase [Candidatus Wallbacteria bacterium HGW-Wallbacteria-1]